MIPASFGHLIRGNQVNYAHTPTLTDSAAISFAFPSSGQSTDKDEKVKRMKNRCRSHWKKNVPYSSCSVVYTFTRHLRRKKNILSFLFCSVVPEALRVNGAFVADAFKSGFTRIILFSSVLSHSPERWQRWWQKKLIERRIEAADWFYYYFAVIHLPTQPWAFDLLLLLAGFIVASHSSSHTQTIFKQTQAV